MRNYLNKIIIFLFFFICKNNIFTTINFHSPHSKIVLAYSNTKFSAPGSSSITGWFNQNLVVPAGNENIKTFDSTAYYSNLAEQQVPNRISNYQIQEKNILNPDNKTIVFNDDIYIPDNKVYTVESNGIIDGQYKNLTLGKNSQLLIDSNVSVTFRNLIFKDTSNTTISQIKCHDNSGIITFDNSILSFNDTFTFERGHLFINNDVKFTGSGEFIYNSINSSYILPHSSLNFGPQSSFLYAPYSTNNNLLILSDKTSCLKFDNSSLKITHTGLKLTHGSLYFDNKVTISSTHQTFNNALILGDLNAGLNYDLSTYILSGARIFLDGRLVLYNTVNEENSLDFASRSSSIVLKNSRSKFLVVNNNGINGFSEQSITYADGSDNNWITDNTTYGFDLGETDPTTNLIYNNSNAIVSQEKEISWNSNAIANLNVDKLGKEIENNSNAIINLDLKVYYNSQSIINDYEIKQDLQNQINYNNHTFATTEIKITNNSNAILNDINQIKYNSDALLNSTNNIHYNSQAIINDYSIKNNLYNQIENNSNAILEDSKYITANSNAILSIDTTGLEDQIRHNSDAIINLDSDLLQEAIKNNSNAIVNLDNNVHYNSQAIVHDYEIKTDFQNQINYNSSAILSIDNTILEEEIKHNSDAILNLDNTVLLMKINNNSNAILYLNTQIHYNSQAILHDYEIKTDLQNQIKYNSNAILNIPSQPLLHDAVNNNSNAIIKQNKDIENNSNAIVKLSFATAGTLQAQIDAINTSLIPLPDDVTDLEQDVAAAKATAELAKSTAEANESEITSLQNNVALITIDVKNNSNAIVTHEYEIINNSNAIVSYIPEIPVNTADIATNSNAIITNTANIDQNMINMRHNSNALIIQDIKIKANSASIVILATNDLNITTSNLIILLTNELPYISSAAVNNNNLAKYNSNAIINLPTQFLANQIKYNSDAIINLDATLLQKEIENNSNAIINLDNNVHYNSQAIVHDYEIKQDLYNQVENNSNAILSIDVSTLLDPIKYNSDAILNIKVTPQETILTQSPITTDITLEKSVFIHPNEKILINGNVTIDGNGAIIIFGNPNHSQFIVEKNKTVTLKNIQLLRINQKTFNLKYALSFDNTKETKYSLENSCIKIGENVLFGLSENVTLSQGLIEIINNDNNQAQTFYLKGIEGQKEFKLAPSDNYADALSKADNGLSWLQRKGGKVSKLIPNYTDMFTQNASIPVLLKCNDNTFAMQNIILSGFEHITKTNSTNYLGAIALIGETNISIGDDTFTEFEKNKNIQETYDMNFIVQDINNKLILIKDDLKFTGRLNFSDFGENELYIQTALTEKITPKLGSNDFSRTIPQINFGTNFMNLNSIFGTAKLIFKDKEIRINNAINGFIAYENSILSGNTIEITGDPIHNMYNININEKNFMLNIDKLIGLNDINNKPIITENYLYEIKQIYALDLIYDQELSNFSKIKQ